MTTLPKIAIQLCTYNRYDEIKVTLEALQDNLIYPKDRITLYVCDDSSEPGYITKLKRLKLFKYWNTKFIITSENKGWGANVNNGLNQIEEDIIFFLEDDYVLTRALDLRIGVGLLVEKPHIGMLRYRATAGSRFIFHQFEADLSNLQMDSAFEDFEGAWYESVPTVPWHVTYLQLGGGSQDLYLYSHGPHLKYKAFHDFYGLYPEGLKLGHTEETFAHTVKHSMQADPHNAPGIAILPDWVTMQWDHIGISYQHSEWDE